MRKARTSWSLSSKRERERESAEELVLFHFSSSVIHGVAGEYTVEGQSGKQVNADCVFIYKCDGHLDYMARKTRERKLPE